VEKQVQTDNRTQDKAKTSQKSKNQAETVKIRRNIEF
jgi:hypothetical protein